MKRDKQQRGFAFGDYELFAEETTASDPTPQPEPEPEPDSINPYWQDKQRKALESDAEFLKYFGLE